MSRSLFNKQVANIFDTISSEMSHLQRIMEQDMIPVSSLTGTRKQGSVADDTLSRLDHEQKSDSTNYGQQLVQKTAPKANQVWKPFNAFENDMFFNDALTSFERFDVFSDNFGWKFPNLDSGMKVEEAKGHYALSIPIENVPQDKVKFTYNKETGLLTVEGEQFEENENGTKYSSKFSRSVTLEPNLDAEKVEARFDDGFLNLLVPKNVKSQQ